MATTDVHSLPYPEATADARLGAADIQALAEALDERLSGALVSAAVATESIPNNTNDFLNLTVDEDETSAVFVNSGALHIEYTGTPTVIATVYGQVTWAGNGTGSRRLRIYKNTSTLEATSRQAPDADPLTMLIAWPVKLATGDQLSLEAWQNSGGALDVTGAKFRCVVHGVSPA